MRTRVARITFDIGSVGKSTLKTMVLLGFSAASLSVSAVELWAPATRITGLYPHDAGFVVYTEYSNPAMSTCGGNRFATSLTNPNYKALAATLLLATATDKTIQMHFNDQTATCEPVFDRFIMQK